MIFKDTFVSKDVEQQQYRKESLDGSISKNLLETKEYTLNKNTEMLVKH